MQDDILNQLVTDRARAHCKKHFGFDPEDIYDFVKLVSGISAILGQEVDEIVTEQMFAEWWLGTNSNSAITFNYKAQTINLVNHAVDFRRPTYFAIVGYAKVNELKFDEIFIEDDK